MTTRDDLVLACTELIAEHGAAALSLRRVAERVGIKAPSIYVHFANKEALLAEASGQAAATLGEFMLADDPGGDPRTRLLATAMGYLRFAEAHPSLFALLLRELPSARSSLAEAPPERSPYRLLLARVADVLGDAGEPAEWLGFGIWSLVHGAAVLRQTHLRDFSGPIVEGTHRNLVHLLEGWCPAVPPQP